MLKHPVPLSALGYSGLLALSHNSVPSVPVGVFPVKLVHPLNVSLKDKTFLLLSNKLFGIDAKFSQSLNKALKYLTFEVYTNKFSGIETI